MDTRGSIIREQRKRLGLNMAQAAQRCQVTEATISRLEAGKMPNASFVTLEKVCEGLGLTLEDLRSDRPLAVPA